jgi:hypothetical protein
MQFDVVAMNIIVAQLLDYARLMADLFSTARISKVVLMFHLIKFCIL